MADDDRETLEAREQRTPELEQEEEDQFAGAFDEATTGETRSDSERGDDDAEAPHAEAESEGGEAATGNSEESGEGGEASGADAGESQSESEGEESWEQVARELSSLFEQDESNASPSRLKHHVKTWHGRYKSERDKRMELEKQLESTRNQTPSSDEGGSQGSDSASSASIDELKSRFSNEYGEDLPQFVQEMVDARAREIAQEHVSQEVKPLQERQQQVDQQEHYNRVVEHHPDADQLADSDDLWQWIDSQPPKLRESYNEVAEKGSADDVVAMLSQYKRDRGITAPSAGQSSESANQQAAAGGSSESSARAPRRPPSRSASGPRRGDADPNDFDSAFDEALKAR